MPQKSLTKGAKKVVKVKKLSVERKQSCVTKKGKFT